MMYNLKNKFFDTALKMHENGIDGKYLHDTGLTDEDLDELGAPTGLARKVLKSYLLRYKGEKAKLGSLAILWASVIYDWEFPRTFPQMYHQTKS